MSNELKSGLESRNIAASKKTPYNPMGNRQPLLKLAGC